MICRKNAERFSEKIFKGPIHIRTQEVKNGSPKPEFEFDEEHTYFQVKLPVHGEVLTESSIELDLTPQVLKLLFTLDKEMSKSKIMQALELEDRKNFRTLYLVPVVESSLVELTIPNKPQSSKQKYRLIDLGKCIEMEK